MSSLFKTISLNPDELVLLKTLYDKPVKELLELDPLLLQSLIVRTEAMGRWLKGIHNLAQDFQKKGN